MTDVPDSPPAARRGRTLVRWTLGAVFVAAGALKIVHPADFYTDILAYEVPLPDEFMRLVALTLPWLEVLCGALLLGNRWVETAGFLIAGMSLAFVVLLGQAVLRGLDLQCGCFGPAVPGWFDQPPAALVRASCLLWGSLWMISSPPRSAT